jgi:hypothetical protein
MVRSVGQRCVVKRPVRLGNDHRFGAHLHHQRLRYGQHGGIGGDPERAVQ